MAEGEDDVPPTVVPLHPRRVPKSEEGRADAQWELMARREARMGAGAFEPRARISTRIRWWVAALFVVALIILLRDRIAEWLPWLGF